MLLCESSQCLGAIRPITAELFYILMTQPKKKGEKTACFILRPNHRAVNARVKPHPGIFYAHTNVTYLLC